MLYNPKWLQVFCYFLIFAFPSSAICLLYWSLFEYLQHQMLPALVYGFCAMFCGCLSLLGFMSYKFVPAKVNYDNDRLTIELRDYIVTHQWQDIASVKHYRLVNLIRLTGFYGNTLLVIRQKPKLHQDFSLLARRHISS